MSSSNGTFYTQKSMNGIITIDDGQGTTISGGDITSTIIHTDDIQAISPSDNVYLYSNNTASVFTGVNSTFKSNNIQAINPADDVYLYTNSTGTIFTGFGTTLSTDDLQGTTPSTNITLYTSTLGGTIDLGTTATSQITIGSSSNNNKIGGVTINDTTLITSSVGSTVNLFNNVVSGALNFMTGLSSGTITIGTTNSTDCFISNINLRGNEIYGRVVTQSYGLYDNITTGIINIGVGLTKALNIATAHTGINADKITIGSSGDITMNPNMTANYVAMGSTSTTTGGLKLYSPLTMSYTSINPTISNQVGYEFPSTVISNNATTAWTVSRRISALPAGVWILIGKVGFGNGGTTCGLSISTTGSVDAVNLLALAMPSTTNLYHVQITRILRVATGTQLVELFTTDNVAVPLNNVYFFATRIA